MKFDLKIAILAGVILVSVGIVLGMDPIPQDPAYHQFADQRTLFGIANFWNVATNVPLVVVGLLGMWRLVRGGAPGYLPQLTAVYLAFFGGVFLTGLGSAYYHIEPRNLSLLFDRLPMIVLFVSFFSMIWGEHVSPSAGRKMIGPMIVVGLAAVGYWYWSELQGQGDLRFYGLVVFVPNLLVFLIMLLYRSMLTRVGYIWSVLAFYGIARVTELLDRQIYELLGGFSGHSIKHLAAAMATFLLFMAIDFRKIR